MYSYSPLSSLHAYPPFSLHTPPHSPSPLHSSRPLPLSAPLPSHPAGAAGALVSDVLDGGALRPLLPCVKGVWQLDSSWMLPGGTREGGGAWVRVRQRPTQFYSFNRFSFIHSVCFHCLLLSLSFFMFSFLPISSPISLSLTYTLPSVSHALTVQAVWVCSAVCHRDPEHSWGQHCRSFVQPRWEKEIRKRKKEAKEKREISGDVM